jgi:hypothetical protein
LIAPYIKVPTHLQMTGSGEAYDEGAVGQVFQDDWNCVIGVKREFAALFPSDPYLAAFSEVAS